MQAEGSVTTSSLLPLLASGDLQNTKKRNKQTVLIFFHGFRICLSLSLSLSLSLLL
jgi:hypothetical protein